MRFTLYPAIDLKDGQCVRLRRGEMEDATIYGNDPAVRARQWQDAGFAWLHVVDLNGAFAGRSENAEAITAILGAVSVPVQLGGGIRDMAAVERWIEAGISRVILGSAAVKTPQLVKDACRAFPGRIAVGIDARDGFVATEGWAETSSVAAVELAARFEDEGVAAIIYTDIGRDGMLTGPNVEQTLALARATTIPVIASGGVGDLSHIVDVYDAGTITGVILGRALYDGRVDPAAALQAVSLR
ncbi:1-(5-phosphoribosyl)-5-[(5-phosphoribosylamino)methylideneamino]imidazole-4-carboxamide isomerase [Granulibacter bethesdensis]|uniref:1-(5-phosphoribosyl)-5-[(5-phosphoribosylamino)methylideneamino] imidazole-4-carboxamide isomerase n=1 Tax=Granulibacter bethesdensis (strain ATCC BAA-1260 / CGDNIH1) TaxID=391165 RepID=HIS4_GRABC|nr:1-(5-phosphoribosyl)-5-[(5-phosphoribosylamino)methylideneamino]imidazole-4-carboxamide isomerase [Granulibacter bethesdensis]Q0BPX3.1 RecName: Full=1-(5-phosphoribosyl)-5-[(5-phosphoribosylamino)methylideneamino] imidazole-4-carboxamide isomerase; AltName: Full=Phosphoribosylformimino-5-aminoimidazole carboxamide ribotide isomerase [Granulibacter bethesdensis CGDNIH1]ABI63129.1 1-(5-phosphoribosyl)-5-[(5-phosphoribosylamino)methylideneamino] imidazole-4-carboxamide isomerase [Granulibacter be